MKTNKKKFRKLQGFSLVEILVSLTLMVFAAGFIMFATINRFEEGKENLARSNCYLISREITRFYYKNQRYPRSMRELPNSSVPDKDPWGNAYQFRFPGTVNTAGSDGGIEFDVFTYKMKNNQRVRKIGNWDRSKDKVYNKDLKTRN